jgi:transposase
MAADGVANSQIAATVGVTPMTVRSWRTRFTQEGLATFAVVREGRGRKPGISPEQIEEIEEIVRLTQHEKPSGETHWSCRSMARQVGVSPATVQRIWSGRGLKPHLVKTFKVSNDPAFGGEAHRCRRALPEPTGEGGGAVHGREDLNSGVGPHPGPAVRPLAST